MDVLRQLGVDQTVWIQLGFFLISYFFLSQFLFKPYSKILDHRKKQTSGTIDEVTKLTALTESLAFDYQGRLKNHNFTAAQIYNQIKEEGHRQEETLLSGARQRAADLIEQARKKVAQESKAAKDLLKNEANQISSRIASRVLGREIK